MAKKIIIIATDIKINKLNGENAITVSPIVNPTVETGASKILFSNPQMNPMIDSISPSNPNVATTGAIINIGPVFIFLNNGRMK